MTTVPISVSTRREGESRLILSAECPTNSVWARRMPELIKTAMLVPARLRLAIVRLHACDQTCASKTLRVWWMARMVAGAKIDAVNRDWVAAGWTSVEHYSEQGILIAMSNPGRELSRWVGFKREPDKLDEHGDRWIALSVTDKT